MIEAKDIQVVFNPGTAIENKALRGMNLQIPESQFVTVIGSNGAGKSTFLNVLAGEIKADAGSVKIDEQDVTNWSTARRSGLVARVFQARWPEHVKA